MTVDIDKVIAQVEKSLNTKIGEDYLGTFKAGYRYAQGKKYPGFEELMKKRNSYIKKKYGTGYAIEMLRLGYEAYKSGLGVEKNSK